MMRWFRAIVFCFNDTATAEIYTLSLHDALPIYADDDRTIGKREGLLHRFRNASPACADRKSTRLNSSRLGISYAGFCLKRKKKNHSQFLIQKKNKKNKKTKKNNTKK